MEQVFFSIPLTELEPIVKRWFKEAQAELPPIKVEQTEPQKQFITIDEASALLNLAKPTIYSKISRGEMPGVCKQGKYVHFEREVLIDWLKQGRRKSNLEIKQEADRLLKREGGHND